MDERDVNALFDRLENLHTAGALTPSESVLKNAAITRGCPNYWPRREARRPRRSRWSSAPARRHPSAPRRPACGSPWVTGPPDLPVARCRSGRRRTGGWLEIGSQVPNELRSNVSGVGLNQITEAAAQALLTTCARYGRKPEPIPEMDPWVQVDADDPRRGQVIVVFPGLPAIWCTYVPTLRIGSLSTIRSTSTRPASTRSSSSRLFSQAGPADVLHRAGYFRASSASCCRASSASCWPSRCIAGTARAFGFARLSV